MNYSIGGRRIDLYDDVGLSLLSKSPYFEKIGSLPVDDPSKIPALADSQFGVVFLTKAGETIRKYPIHDYAHTLLANVYFELTKDQLPPEARVTAATQIKNASVRFGMKPFEAVEKYASDASAEGLNYIRLGQVKVAEPVSGDLARQLLDEYEANREKYGREDRRKLAQAMLDVADRFGLEIPADLKPFAIKEAALDREALKTHCLHRASLVQDKPGAAALLDELIEKAAGFDPKETVQLLETFDRQFGLDGYWDRGLEPNLVLAEKSALECAVPASPYASPSKEELASFVSGNSSLLQKMFGKEFAEKVQKDPNELMSLPSASRDFLKARMEHARSNVPSEAK